MYVDARDGCVDMNFILGTTGVGTAVPTRRWSIKVTQYHCNHDNLAPSGCTQYFFNPTTTTGTVQTFNYGRHLANQNQNICVRRERGFCKICWHAANVADFAVSGKDNMKGYTKSCCSYGEDGMKTEKGNYDCVTIPNAEKSKGAGTIKGEKFCGSGKGLVSDDDKDVAKTICSRREPFSLRFLSDQYEFEMEAKQNNKGAKLTYTLQACT